MSIIHKGTGKSMDYGIQDYYADNITDSMLIGYFSQESDHRMFLPGISILLSVDRSVPVMSLNIYGMPALYQLLDALRDETYFKAEYGDQYHTLELRMIRNEKWWVTITTIVDLNDEPSYMNKTLYGSPIEEFVVYESGHTPPEKLRRVSISLRLSQERIDQLIETIAHKIEDINSRNNLGKLNDTPN